jgi:ribosomal protein S18 acetylase RimI-like enzyme
MVAWPEGYTGGASNLAHIYHPSGDYSVIFPHNFKHEGTIMMLEWSYSLDNLDWEELSRLYLAAPLGHKDPSDLKVAFSNSMFKCFVYDSGRLVAVGRALADGRDCSYICDVAVLPSHQGLGIGKQVVSKLVERSQGHKKIIL